MKMSHAYMLETVAHLEAAGFACERSTDAPSPTVQRASYSLRRDDCAFVLECVERKDQNPPVSYYVEWVRMGPVRATSFELDSWKHRPDRVEFKFYTHPESGQGLALVLQL